MWCALCSRSGGGGLRGPGWVTWPPPAAGVNLLVGTENGLMLLDRSGQGKVYGLIGRRRFQQMDVLEGLNLLITISGTRGAGRPGRRRGCGPRRAEAGGRPGRTSSEGLCVRPAGKRNKLRVYYLSWLRNKILHNDPEVEKKQGWTTVGDMEGCGHYRVGERRSLQGVWAAGLSLGARGWATGIGAR